MVEVFTDNDLSAYSGKRRPRYRAMLEAIRAGRVDAVIAWHNDRLHRSPTELEEYIVACEPRSVPTHCVKAGPLDLTTANGRMTARITGAVTRGEVEHMSERICAQKARATADGKWTGGGRPFGYTRDGMALVPAEADAIRDGVRRVLAGESVYSITKSWQGTVAPVRGGTWHAQNVHRVLTRPRNAGLAAHHGEVVGAGSWPAIITEDEHRAVCAVLKDPSRSTYSGVRSLKWVGSGLYRCARCGADMRSASAVNRDGTLRRTYRCRSGTHITINAAEVDEFVTKTVCALLDKHGAVTRPRDGIPLAGSEGHRARRARHPCVGRCPSERVIHLTAREQISYSRSKADSCGMILSSGERVVPGPVHPPGGRPLKRLRPIGRSRSGPPHHPAAPMPP